MEPGGNHIVTDTPTGGVWRIVEDCSKSVSTVSNVRSNSNINSNNSNINSNNSNINSNSDKGSEKGSEFLVSKEVVSSVEIDRQKNILLGEKIISENILKVKKNDDHENNQNQTQTQNTKLTAHL